MNIENQVVSDEKKKSDKLLKVIFIFIVILILLSSVVIGLIYYLQQTEFKFTVNNVAIKNYSNDLFLFNTEGKVYISIKDLAGLIDYKAYNGSYGNQEQYSEDNTKCYVEGKDEVASFELNSNQIYKVNTNSKETYGYYTISEPVIQKNGKLYTGVDGISKAFNIVFEYNKKSNKIAIYTLPFLVNAYKGNIKNADLESFDNQKALLYNLIIVGNVSSDSNNTQDIKYGVSSLNGSEIIGTKYKEIQFIEGSKEFLVKTVNNKVGIILTDGTTKIQPQYDNIKQIDNNSNLYLVENNKKQGVIDENGRVKIYLEFDKIGIDLNDFPASDIKNPYLLFDNAIPVCKNEKWGLFDKTGKQILNIEYDNFGCIVNGKIENSNSVIVIPEIKGIVVSKIVDENPYYAIVNYKGSTLVPLALSSVYSVINKGEQDYYMINLKNTLNVVEWVNKRVNTIKETTQEKNTNEVD